MKLQLAHNRQLIELHITIMPSFKVLVNGRKVYSKFINELSKKNIGSIRRSYTIEGKDNAELEGVTVEFFTHTQPNEQTRPSDQVTISFSNNGDTLWEVTCLTDELTNSRTEKHGDFSQLDDSQQTAIKKSNLGTSLRHLGIALACLAAAIIMGVFAERIIMAAIGVVGFAIFIAKFVSSLREK